MPECVLFSFASECDIPNWITLIIEILIGGSLASIFYTIQQKQSAKIQNIIDEQETLRKKRVNWAITNLISILPTLKENLSELSENVANYTQVPKETELSETFAVLIEANDLMRDHYVSKLEKIVDHSIGILDPALLNELQDILQIAEKTSRIVTEKGIEIKSIGYARILSSIDSLLNKLNNMRVEST